MKPKPGKRLRRNPSEARALILRAAQDLFREQTPDTIGLKDIARRAGVSHSLVSHYFGTKEALVEEAIEDLLVSRREELLVRMASTTENRLEDWIGHIFETLSHPAYAKLAGWMLLAGRIDDRDFFAKRLQGPRILMEAYAGRQASRGVQIDRDDLEFGSLLVICAAYGYSLGKNAFLPALGLSEGEERDAWFRRRLTEALAMVERAGEPEMP
ncbi:MAG: helix-turn-helix domain-containing protein [Myxococcota bacterium]